MKTVIHAQRWQLDIFSIEGRLGERGEENLLLLLGIVLMKFVWDVSGSVLCLPCMLGYSICVT